MMVWLRMVAVALRLAGPDLCAPWRSTLLRWRMETYGVLDEDGRLLHAERITPERFFRFLWSHRSVLVRFLRWAACL